VRGERQVHRDFLIFLYKSVENKINRDNVRKDKERMVKRVLDWRRRAVRRIGRRRQWRTQEFFVTVAYPGIFSVGGFNKFS
jgi:hypothetical protein